jgi:hypothetical protein
MTFYSALTNGARFGTLLGCLLTLAAVPVRAAEVRFATDVVPVFTRLGCNSGGCHGKATGQNGFRLSLLGFEPDQDYEALLHEGGGRRVSRIDPVQSLLLLKATASVPHGGGRLVLPGSEDYAVIRDWLAAGARPPSAADPSVVRVAVEPSEAILKRGARQPLRVLAYLSDGSSREVTGRAVYSSNEPELAVVDREGVVQIPREGVLQSGLATVMARFADKIATFHLAVPFSTDDKTRESIRRRLDEIAPALELSTVDRHLLAQWRKLGTAPSGPADDATFLRRVTLDICGTLPTPKEVAEYLSDPRPDKRARLVDRLLERPEYASYFALKWADILQNRGAGYSTSKQRPGTTLFAGWIRDSLAANKPYDQFVGEILTATGSQNENPPAIWYRTLRKGPEYVEAVAQAFLGVRVQCAQCHHHPAERWSQSDYYSLAAAFSRIGRKGGFADAEVPTDEIIYVRDTGSVVHPRTGEAMQPRALGGPLLEMDRFEDPRQALARWMTRTDNPFFARTMANRMWAHFLGRGIVHPIDDARSTNPPSNPALLDVLAQEFTRSGYDVKHLIRAITGSYAYRLQSSSLLGNQSDTQTFARFYPRRLTSEVLLDGISQVLEVPTEFAGGPSKFASGMRAIDLPDENVPMTFLEAFGRPLRKSACECERTDAPSLTQALELINSPEIQRKLASPSGYAERLAAGKEPHAERVTAAFRRFLAREPSADERAAAVKFLEAETDQRSAYRSLLWSLLATNEFIFNH